MSAESDEREETFDLLQINKALFDGDGDRIAALLADYVRARQITISPTAWRFLSDAVEAERQRAAERQAG